MKSMSIFEFGNSNVFQLVNSKKPSVKPGHLLIKVQATSVNPLDFKLRKGSFPEMIPQFPMVLHGDVAGIVTEVGENVTKFKVGDEVYGCVGGFLDMSGALAEYMLADADLMALKPNSISFLEAAALPLVSLSAWEALVTKSNLQKDQSILIHGGTGGVGHLAIQLAKCLGAKVYSTSSDEKKLAITRQLGADVAINYKKTSVDEYVAEHSDNSGFEVIFDTVGGENIHQCIQAAAQSGQIISLLPGKAFDSSSAFYKNLTIHFVFQPLPLITGINRAHYGEVLEKIASLVDEGVIKPLIDEHVFSIPEVAMAHDHLENGNAIGKVVMHGF
jgi:NADPH:quinone reductase